MHEDHADDGAPTVNWDILRGRLANVIAEASGGDRRVAVVVRDLAIGGGLDIGGDVVFKSASIVKLLVMTTVLEDVGDGRLSLEERVPLGPAERVGGAGVLHVLQDVDDMSVRDLLTLMIAVSDNLATNVLVDAVSMTAVNATAARLGLTATALRRLLMTADPAFAAFRNDTSAADTVRLLTLLAERRDVFAAPALYDIALAALRRQQHVDLLPRLLPAGMAMAHKTGTLDGVRHDAGLLLVDDRPRLALAVFTSMFDGAERQAEELVSRIGAEIGAAVASGVR